MKRLTTLLLMTVLILTSVLFPVTVFAEDETAPPVVGEEIPTEVPETEPLPVPLLTKIEFNGASFPTEFQQNVFEYTVNISSHDEFSLKSYSCTDYNAEMKIDYISNANGSTKGIIVTVKNATGTNDYKFYFDTVQTMPKTSDTSLIGVNFNYGELYPSFRSDVYKYTLYLPSDLEVLVVDPITSDENATINTPSQISLKKDQNTPISIKVTSSDGTSTGSYKLTIKRVDKTIADIQQMMESPDFKSFVEIPFYNHATFYIITAGVVFAIMLIAVIIMSLRKSKKEPSQNHIQIILPAGSAIVPPTMLSTNDLPKNVIPENNIVTSTQDDTEKENASAEEIVESPVQKKIPEKKKKKQNDLRKLRPNKNPKTKLK